MAQSPSGPIPVPRQRTMSTLPQKKNLIELFLNFTSSAVEQKHEDLAKACVSLGPSRYQYVRLASLLERNQDKPDYLSTMISVFEFLMRYLINLLKPKRPQVWRSIRTSTPSFQNRVECMEGARDVLADAGYSENVEGAVQFPDSVNEPDKRKLATIAAELLIAKFEVEGKSRSPSRNPRRGESVGNIERERTGGAGGAHSRGGYTRSGTMSTGDSISSNFPHRGGGGGVYRAGGDGGTYPRESYGYDDMTTRGTAYNSNNTTTPPENRHGLRSGNVHQTSQGISGYPDGRSGGVGDGQSYGAREAYSSQSHVGQGSEGIGDPGLSNSRRVYGSDGYHQIHDPGYDHGVVSTSQPGGRDPSDYNGNDHGAVQSGGRDCRYLSNYNDGQISTQLPYHQVNDVYGGDQGGRVAASSSQASPRQGVHSGDQGSRVAVGSSQASPRHGVHSEDQGGGVAVGSPRHGVHSGDQGGPQPSPRQNVQNPVHPVAAPRRKKTLSTSSSNSSITSPKPRSGPVIDYPPYSSQSPQYDKPSTDAYSSQYSGSHCHNAPSQPSEFRPLVPPPSSKKHPSLDSTGSSGGDSNVDLQSSSNSSEKKVDDVRSSRQRDLDEFRRKKAMVLDKSKTSYVEAPMSLSSNIGRKKATTDNQGTAMVEDISSSRTAAFNPSLAAIKRPPPKSQQPKFRDDAILERNEPSIGSDVSDSMQGESISTGQKQPRVPLRANMFEDNSQRIQPDTGCGQSGDGARDPQPIPQGIFCKSCKNKLSERHKFCPFCGSPVPEGKNPNIGGQQKNHTPKPSASKPRSQPIDDFPLRADPEEADRLVRVHHTRIMMIDDGGKGSDLERGIPLATPVTPMTTSVNRELSGIEQMKLKEAARKKYLEKKTPSSPHESSVGFKQSETTTTKNESSRPHHWQDHPSSYPRNSSVAASSSSVASPLSLKSGVDQLRDKEEALKAHHRSKGVKEEELGHIVEEFRRGEAECKVQKERCSVPPSKPSGGMVAADKTKKTVITQSELNTLARENIGAENFYQKEIDESDRMHELGKIGQCLLDAIKFCSPDGFALGEIQIAFMWSRSKAPRDVLRYLKEEWTNMTRNVCERVAASRCDGVGASVGRPTEKKAREVLVEMKGRINDAVYRIFCQRKEKINRLLQKMEYMRKIENSLPVLEWDAAVTALTRNGMDVDKTCLAIQTERLQPVYEYIFGEYTGVAKTDMEEIKKIISNQELYPLELYPLKARYRLLMAEYKFNEMFRAKNVLDLLERTEGENYPLNYFIDAAKDFKTLEEASNFLIKLCPICYLQYPIHEMVTMPGCTDSLCKECFKAHFAIKIREQGVKHFNCPLCGLPDMAEKEATEGMYIDIFVAMIREHLDHDVYSICMEKLKDYNLTKDPGFVWCPNDCRSGFIYDADVPRVPRDIQCPNCKKRMCLKCKKTWEGQHEGITCEAFAKWKQDNDPDAQRQGLAAHLNANGIECPQCHMRYDLARGGCMHFRCTRCPNEFCSGCSKSFKNGKKCGKLKSCDKKGLHAHHPRDCLFYLRDKDVDELQQFLEDNNVKFDVDLPEKQEAAMKEDNEDGEGDEELPGGGGAAKKPLKCIVVLQKETPQGLIDEECGAVVQDGHAGLCQLHYKEYLVDKINKNKLDPITIYNTEQVKVMLSREELKVPVQNEDEDREQDQTDEQFREILIQEVKRVLPLTAIQADAPQEIEVEDLEEPVGEP